MRNYFLMSLIFVVGAVKANNISVSNVTLAGQNVSAGVNNAANFTYIEFDLTWENSWRTSAAPNNWDAAWVFVKYRTTGSSAWNHVKLAPSGHNTSPTSPTTSYSVQVGLVDESVAHNATTNPAVGAFIYRSANGSGTFSANDIRLKWFYRDNGVGDNDIIDVEVYAIEMVYVPDGSFFLGNNGNTTNTTNAFYKYVSAGNNTSYEITSEGVINGQWAAPSNVGFLTYPEQGSICCSTQIAAAFPKGYKGFYCMKYEGSQQNWVDYLNSLTAGQIAATSTTAVVRNGISVTAGVYSTTLPFVPFVGVDWPRLAAYLDWAGLRPMTEFEFEKACRGPQTPVTDEFAWGSTSSTAHTGAAGALNNAGLTNEKSNITGANYSAFMGGSYPTSPVRCGSFASASSSRSDAGATYYGIMEMSGNVLETTVYSLMATNSMTSSSYTGLHGNGTISTGGYSDVVLWPGLSSGLVTTEAIGARGGGQHTSMGTAANLNRLRVADRQYAYSTSGTVFDQYPSGSRGVRGVHTKPNSSAETK
jgi:formylglycine-generating enzyme required for sulfatase activity